MTNKRVDHTINNISYSLLTAIPVLLLSFVARFFFTMYLSEEYLGANGLFTNILTLLSFAELGIGDAIVFSLYKPLANNDHAKINALLKLYKKCYFWISVVIAVAGIVLIPFLPVLTNHSTLPNLVLIYLMYLATTVISYFYADCQSFLMADQRKYIVTNSKNISLIVQYIVQVIVLIVTRNFIAYLSIQIISQLGMNWYIKYYIKKKYNYIDIKNAGSIEESDLNVLKKNVFALMFHKVGSILVDNTDNIIISSFIGLAIGGIYSNYLLFITSLTSIFVYISGATYASVGNLCATIDDPDYKYNIFKKLDFFNFMIYGISSVCLFAVLTPCVEFISNGGDTLGFATLATIIINFLLNGMRIATNQFKNASGLFWNDRMKPILESITNLILSIWWVKYMGLFGVLFATVVTRIFITCAFEQYVAYKNIFNKKFIKLYVIFIFKVIVILLLGYLSYNMSMLFIDFNIIVRILLSGIITLIACLLLMVLIYHNSEEYKYFYNLAFNIVRKFKR